MEPELIEFFIWFMGALMVTIAVPVMTVVAIIMVLKNV